MIEKWEPVLDRFIKKHDSNVSVSGRYFRVDSRWVHERDLPLKDLQKIMHALLCCKRGGLKKGAGLGECENINKSLDLMREEV